MNNILDIIKKSNRILILTHENPDGDAIGSAIATYYFLSDIGKDVAVLLPDVPPIFYFLTQHTNIIEKSDKQYDLAIVLDCSTMGRIFQKNNEFSRCATSIVIDHHISNTQYGSINYVEGNTSSCCQVLYYLFKSWNVSFTKQLAEALITGLLTDTSGFANSNVDAKSFEMVNELYGMGIDFHNLYNRLISKKNIAQYNLMKLVMNRLEFFENGKIAFSYITKQDFVDTNANLGDHEGLVDIGRNIEGVEVSIFIREDDCYYISFRANGKIDVNKIAMRLGGGGHFEAAGAKSSKIFEETKELVLNETKKEFII